jgi:hypothetical protein
VPTVKPSPSRGEEKISTREFDSRHRGWVVPAMAMKASTAKLIASDFVSPDLKRIRRFIAEAVAEGAIAELIAAIIALLARMRDLNQELSRQMAWKNRKRPASETTHRLQLELPFVALATPEPPANDTSSDSDEDGEKTKRKGRKEGVRIFV